MSFDIDRCRIKKYWCGEAAAVPNTKEYKGVGTRHQCLQQGFGAGMYSEKRKSLPSTSLQQIAYIGPDMEANFKNMGIFTNKDLLLKMKKLDANGKEKLLKKVLQNKNNTLNGKAYNSVILFLHGNGILKLPQCSLL